MDTRGSVRTLLAAVFALAAVAAQAAPGTNREVKPADARMPALPPAEFDETLAIGGEDVDARKVRTRMTVDVAVNGTGPHRFVVDSGADTSVVGIRLAEDLSLPPAPPGPAQLDHREPHRRPGAGRRARRGPGIAL